jgi:hypothetical protein
MNIKKSAFLFSITLLAALALAIPASADTLNLVLSNPVQTAIPSATLTFDASASAPFSNGGTMFLNGDNFNLSLNGALIDDSAFLLNFPLSLDPGVGVAGSLFTVTLPSNIAPGTYTGFFSILGGSDSDAQDTIATVNFEIDAPAAVPEPGTWLLLATGLLLLAALLYRRSKIGDARFIPQQ